jgi:hypothetical protein
MRAGSNGVIELSEMVKVIEKSSYQCNPDPIELATGDDSF